MAAGKRDRRLGLLRKTEGAPDSLGHAAVSWSQFAKTWAELLTVSDAERVKALAAGVAITLRFRVLSSSVTRQLTSADRLSFEGEIYELAAKPKPVGRNKELEISAALIDEAKS